MAGLITSNTLLKQAEGQIEQRLKGGVRESYMKIVVAGMKYALKDGPKSILAQLKDSQDPITDVVKGAIGIVGLLRRAAKGSMPIDALIPAAMVLVLQGLDQAEKFGLLKVGKPEIDQATQLFVETLLPQLGLTPEKLAQMNGRVQKLMADPEQMAKLRVSDTPQQGA